MKSTCERNLERREAEALGRVRDAARNLRDSVVAAGRHVVSVHPWALPSVGFCAGVLAPFLLPARGLVREPSVSFLDDPDEAARGIGDDLRAIAAGALAQSFAVLVDRLLVSDGSPCHTEGAAGEGKADLT